ncbi:MAG TPA: penicillin-binding transpeptidase domain-containing protein [Holophagaceae bacterium]|nr:penicillin-binding transpeptidase domain-containing protein [Holophagaceae bacterium]
MRKVLFGIVYALVKAGDPWSDAAVQKAFAPYDYCLLVQEGFTKLERTKGIAPADRFNPCSTYKLPHALMALDLGVVTPETVLHCDGKECHADHGDIRMAEAIRQSCVGYFRQVARRIGKVGEQAELKKLGYPVTTIQDPIDQFWLHGAFKVSAAEQLDWVRNFYTEDFGLRPGVQAVVRAMSEKRRTPAWTLYGKTGSSQAGADGVAHGWFIGEVHWADGRRSIVSLVIRGKGPDFLGVDAQKRLESLLGA